MDQDETLLHELYPKCKKQKPETKPWTRNPKTPETLSAGRAWAWRCCEVSGYRIGHPRHTPNPKR